MGGAIKAIDFGFQQREIQEAAYRVQREVESGEQVVVGVNRFRDDEVHTPELNASIQRGSASRSSASGA